jgi:membrane-associated phospholipid phosphatase
VRVSNAMPVAAAFVVAALTIVIIVVGSGPLGQQSEPTAHDTTDPDSFLVDWLSSHRRGRTVVETLDHRVWGGAMLGLGLAIVIAATAGVGLLLVDVRTDTAFARLDEAAAAWGGRNASEASTAALGWLTDLGDTKILIGAVVVVGLVEWRRSRSVAPLAFMLTVALGASFANGLLKQIIERDRPDVVALVPVGDTSSFPSGHSAAAAACWAALALVASRDWRYGHRRWAVAVGAGIAVLVASTRVLLAAHWLTDVLAGLVVGWAWCLLVALVYGTKLRQLGDPARRAAARTESDSGASPASSGSPARSAA